MPNNIDTRIVEMEFDNAQFERGAKTTLTTLDNLKSSLDFRGTEKGFDSLAAALSKMDFGSGISSSMEIGIQSMSKFQAFTLGVFEEIGRKVTNLGTSIANELLFAQKKAGFGEYELELGSVQTIQASTGKDFKEIYGYLAELNKYADRTIYSFRDMTSNIGKFTNAGVDLDVAVKAIQGISNEAALSGANAQEASRAMYNFSQALSAGYVKLIDWKSIENANMATVGFKQQLIDTALELGTVVKEGDKYISTTTDMNGKISAAFDATANFNDSLSAQWMTSEVLTKALAKYSDETTDIGKRAYSAAQDVKSFSQMIDTLKEAIGSGWAETFRLIFGEFEDAKKLWTGVSNVLGGVIDRFSDLRNHALRYWKQEGGRTKLLNSLIRLWKIFSERVGIVEKSFSAAFPAINKLGNVLTSITNRFQKFTISLKKGLLGNQESLDIFRNRTDRVFHGLRALIKAVREIASAFATVFKTALKSANEELEGTMDIAEIFEKIALHIFHAAKAIKNWVTESSRLQALSIIFKGIVAVGQLIVEIFKQVYSAFRPVVKETSNSEPTFLNLIAKIAELVIRFKDFITETKIVEKAIRKIIDIVKKLRPLLDGFKEGFSFFKDKEFAKGLKSIGDGFKNLFSSIFSGFGKSKDTTNTAKKEVKNIANSTGSVYGKLVNIFKKFLNSIKNLFNKFKNAISGLFGGIGDATKNAGKETERQATGLTFVAQKLLECLSKAVDKLKPLGEQLKNSIANIFGGFNKSSKKASKDANEAAERPVSMIDNFIAKAKELLHKINEGINVTAITETIGEGLKKVWIGLTEDPLLTALVGGWLQIIQIAKTVVSPIKSFSENIDTLTDGAKRSMYATTGFVNSLKSSVDEWKKAKTAEMFRDIAVAMLLVAASVALITYAFSKDGAAATVGLGAVVGLMIEMSAIVKGLSKAFPNPVDLSKATSAMLKMAIALLVMSKAIAAIAKAGQDGNMPSLIVAISGLILIMYAMAGLIKTLLKSTSDLGKSRRGVTKTMKAISAMFIALAIALWIISKPVKSLAKLSWEQLARGMAGVVALMGVLAGYMAIISKLKLEPKQLSTSMTFIYSLAFALGTLAGIVGAFGKMDSESLTSGLIGVTAITGILLIFLYVMGQTLKDVKPKVISSAASATIMIAIAIRILASAIKSLSDLSFSEMGPALAAIGLALAGIVVALIALAKLGGGGGSMVLAATALLITAVALQAITAAVKKMEDIKWDKVKGGLLAVGLVAAGLVVLSFFAEPMIALAGAFAIFGAGVLLVGTGVKRIGKGIQLFVKSILSLVGAWPMIKTVIGEAIEFAVGYFPMVATKLVEAIKVFAEKIIETAPTIAKAIGALVMATFESFYGWIPDIVDEAIKIVKHVLNALEDNADDIFSSLFSIIISLLTKLEENMPEITTLLGNIIFDLIIGTLDVLTERIPELAEKMFTYFITLLDTLSTMFDDEHVDAFVESAGKLVDNFINALITVFNASQDKILDIGPLVVKGIVRGIVSRSKRVARAILRLLSGALKIAKNHIKEWKEIGKDLVKGLINGIKNKAKDLKDEVKKLGKKAIKSLKEVLGIASPSKITFEDGKFFDLGLAKGIKKYSKYAEKESSNTANKVASGLAGIEDSMPSFDTGMDIYPVVTPVLNSKNLEDGASKLQGMFAAMDEQDVGVQFPSYMGTVSADISSDTASTLNASINDETRQLYEELKAAVGDLTEMLSNVTIISDEATIAASVDLDGKEVGRLMVPVVDAKMTAGARKAKTKTAQ